MALQWEAHAPPEGGTQKRWTAQGKRERVYTVTEWRYLERIGYELFCGNAAGRNRTWGVRRLWDTRRS
jgi:hypothetical protein